MILGTEQSGVKRSIFIEVPADAYIVTSSIRYEAERLVMRHRAEVRRRIKHVRKHLPLAPSDDALEGFLRTARASIRAAFDDYRSACRILRWLERL